MVPKVSHRWVHRFHKPVYVHPIHTCTVRTPVPTRSCAYHARQPPPHQQRRCEGFDANFVAIIRNAQAPRTPTRSHTRASRPCLGPRPRLVRTHHDIRHGVRRLAAMGRQWVRHGRVRGVCCCDVDVASLRGALGHICVGFTACTSSFARCGV
jgi:hypothetical protein